MQQTQYTSYCCCSSECPTSPPDMDVLVPGRLPLYVKHKTMVVQGSVTLTVAKSTYEWAAWVRACNSNRSLKFGQSYWNILEHPLMCSATIPCLPDFLFCIKLNTNWGTKFGTSGNKARVLGNLNSAQCSYNINQIWTIQPQVYPEWCNKHVHVRTPD